MAAKHYTSTAKNNISGKEATSPSQDAMQFTPCTVQDAGKRKKAFMASTSYIATKKGHSSEADSFQSQKR